MSNHPYWMAITNIHQRRLVPDHKDGRTAAEKAAQDNVPYISLWLDEADPRTPAPFLESNILKVSGFDSSVARDICLQLLLQRLQFCFYHTVGPWGMCLPFFDLNGNWQVTIYIDANLIWPLLETRIVLTEAERRAAVFRLASALLHEMAHAAAGATRAMTLEPKYIQTTTFAHLVTKQGGPVWSNLVALGERLFGSRLIHVIPSSQVTFWYHRSTHQTFFENEPLGEEGMDFEKQLWGGRLAPLGTMTRMWFSILEVGVTLRTWPPAHPQPLQVSFIVKFPLSCLSRAVFLETRRLPERTSSHPGAQVGNFGILRMTDKEAL